MTTRDRTRAQLLIVAELTLAAVSVAAVLSLRRVFQDGSFLGPVLSTVLLGHLVAALLRRRKVPHLPALLGGLVIGVGVVTWLRLRSTAWFGIVPTSETLSLARVQLHDAMHVFGQVQPPAPVLPGFVLLASAGAWLVAFTADAAAFRARAQLEAIIPGTTLFVFGGALGTGRHRLDIAAFFVAAVLLHWLAQRSLAAASAPAWLASEKGGGTRALLRVGAVLVLTGVVAAVVVGPHLPGADARAVVPWRASDRKAPDSRVTISPLVDIRTRIVDQANTIVFTVKSTQRAYWRLTSLEKFDGRIWSSNRQYEPAKGTLGSDVNVHDAKFQTVQQQFTINALSAFWLPSAFRPVKLSGTPARYDTDSNSLLTEADTATGLRYSVTSAVPALSAAQLEAVAPVAPKSIADEYTELPADFSVRVQQLAGEIVRGARTQYDKALALQNFFRGGSFTYDLNVPAGHSDSALDAFQFRTRRGYCEQFSGAYAAMARAVGLPARVAVGFTPGEYDAATGLYTVRGFNGHAWPEVYLNGYGWVAFEPTPGRGMPGAQSYTNVPEAQAQLGNPSSATTVPTTAPAPAGGATTTTSTLNRFRDAGGSSTTTHHRSPWPRRLLVVLGVLLVVPLAWVGLLAIARARRRRRRRRAATTPEARVLVAWDEVTEALARAGAPPNPWETPSEFAVRAAGATGVDRRLLAGLAGLTTRAVYGPIGVAEAVADQAAEAAGTLEDAADAAIGRRHRIRRLIDPRPLLPDRRRRVDVRERV